MWQFRVTPPPLSTAPSPGCCPHPSPPNPSCNLGVQCFPPSPGTAHPQVGAPRCHPWVLLGARAAPAPPPPWTGRGAQLFFRGAVGWGLPQLPVIWGFKGAGVGWGGSGCFPHPVPPPPRTLFPPQPRAQNHQRFAKHKAAPGCSSGDTPPQIKSGIWGGDPRAAPPPASPQPGMGSVGLCKSTLEAPGSPPSIGDPSPKM